MAKTKSMARLAKIYQKPESLLMDKKTICKAADISLSTYNKIMRDPDFKKTIEEIKFQLLARGKGAVIQTLIEKALSGDVQAMKLFLQLGGDLSQDNKGVVVQNTITNVRLSKEERKKIDGLIRRREDICSE